MAIIAVIFDFDDTLIPDSTTALLEAHGIKAKTFWANARRLVEDGYDAALAYLRLLLDNVGKDKPLGELTNEKLYKFGAKLDSTFFPGIPGLFGDLRVEVQKYHDIQIEFFVVSGGLKPIVDGTRLVREGFVKTVYASQLAGDTEGGVLKYIKRCVTFTEKTRYLFEINKGLDPKKTARKPHLVNKRVPLSKRPVPFRNMIYVGDGLTDIPCFSLVRKADRLGKGAAFGVFDPTQKDAKTAFREFLREERVAGLHFPRYRDRDELGIHLRGAVASRCTDITIERAQVEADEDDE